MQLLKLKYTIKTTFKKKKKTTNLSLPAWISSQKCAKSFTINQKQILTKRRQKNSPWFASDLLLTLSFLLKGKSHMSLGENSNFSLMLLG